MAAGGSDWGLREKAEDLHLHGGFYSSYSFAPWSIVNPRAIRGKPVQASKAGSDNPKTISVSVSLLSLCQMLPFVSESSFLTELLTLKSIVEQIRWLDGR